MAEITTTLVVNFNGSGNSVLQAEVDSREDGYNAGDTSFYPGDEPHYLVYQTSDVTISLHVSSAGVVSKVISETRQIEELIVFADSRQAQTKYPINGNFTYKWLGNNPGALAQQGENTLVLAAKGTGVAKCTYDALHEVYKISNLPQTLSGEADFTVAVVIVGDTDAT